MAKTLMDSFFAPTPEEQEDLSIGGITLTADQVRALADMFRHEGYPLLVLLIEQLQRASVDGSLGSYGEKKRWQFERANARYLAAAEVLGVKDQIMHMLLALNAEKGLTPSP